MKTIFYLLLGVMNINCYALVTCTPSSCIPACDSSCTYYVCDGASSHTFTIATLPSSEDTTPTDACSHSALSPTDLPFTDSTGSLITNLPSSVEHSYKICQSYENNGPACPPPPPLVPPGP